MSDEVLAWVLDTAHHHAEDTDIFIVNMRMLGEPNGRTGSKTNHELTAHVY